MPKCLLDSSINVLSYCPYCPYCPYCRLRRRVDTDIGAARKTDARQIT